MLTHPNIDPVALDLGFLKVHWYGLMYLVAFGGGWALGHLRARDAFRGWRSSDVDDIVFYFAVGAILGGRMGYVFFYAPAQFLADPLMLFRVWEGGMSFHGGMLGTIAAMWLFARRREGWTFFQVADFVAPLVPIGLGAGRIGNFINGNLWGKPSDLPWAMVFPGTAAGGLPRHPSQLYEALLEGAVLFVILWLYSRRPRPLMTTSGLFLAGYGGFRFLIEFVRVPDAHIGYLAFNWVTMGHVLTLPMIIIGVALLWLGFRRAGADDGQGSVLAAAQAAGVPIGDVKAGEAPATPAPGAPKTENVARRPAGKSAEQRRNKDRRAGRGKGKGRGRRGS